MNTGQKSGWAGLVVEARWPNEVHRTERGRPSGASEADMQAEAGKMIADTGKATVRALCARLRAQGKTADTTKAAAAVRAARACSKNTKGVSIVFLEQASKDPPTLPRHVREDQVVASQNAEKSEQAQAPAPTPATAPVVVAANDDDDAAFARFWNRAHGRVVIAVPAGVAP